MKKSIKRFNCFIVVLAICAITLPGKNSAKAASDQIGITEVNAVEQALDEAEDENEGDVIGVGVISIQNDALETFSSGGIYENASIVGDGVRLRKKPNKDATILELMYNNEAVCINYTPVYNF